MATNERIPHSVTLDGYQASLQAWHELVAEDEALGHVTLRSCKYLNNPIEQDHRNIKSRIKPMKGFQSFRTAATTLAGVELLQSISKGQFVLGALDVAGKMTPEI